VNAASRRVRNVYLALNVFIWLPTSLIVGINTLFLLDGGLSNVQAFAANAFYTIGLAVFELPTGIVADTWGRRTSFLVGSVIQLGANLMYVACWYWHAAFWLWAVASVLLGLGYTFFSGAVDAWLVDSLKHEGYTGDLDPIFAKGQIINGAAMLLGTVAGAFIAQLTSFGVPYLVRAGLQLAGFVIAFAIMKEVAFTPSQKKLVTQVRELGHAAVKYGLGKRPIRWTLLAAPFYVGTGIYGFYAAQPYLLKLFGDPHAIGIAGIAAAGIAGTQVAGGFAVPWIRRRFERRTHILLASAILTVVALALIGLVQNFYVVVALLLVWAMASAASVPVRQAYLNSLIPSEQRATVLSFDSMVSSSGGVVFQPILGRVADTFGYATSYVVSAGIAFIGVPFLIAARRENVPEDLFANGEPTDATPASTRV
jgi:MFS family permease